MFTEPAVGKAFFGREEVLGLLDKRVKAMKDGYRQNIAITGMSLAGKSSLLQHFLYTAIDDSFLPIYIEVMRETFQSFADKFLATLLYNSLKTKEEFAYSDLDSLIRMAQPHFPKTVTAVKTIMTDIKNGLIDEAYMNLLGLTETVKNETSKSCIVILDEFDNIANFKIKNPFLNFGKAIMIQKDTMYIISSSRNAAIKRILQEKLSLLFGNFELVNIRGFEPNAASCFLRKKAEPYSIDANLEKFIIFFTNGNPFYVERLITDAKHVAQEAKTGLINRDVLEDAIIDLVYGPNGTIHQYVTNLLLDLIETRSRDSLIDVLSAIACGCRKQRDIAKYLKKGHGDVSKALVLLQNLGLANKNGVFWSVADRMLEFWLSHVDMRRKKMLINYIVDRDRANRLDLRDYINDFLKESERSPVDRISELFNMCSGEYVEIEDKKLALPQSDKVHVRTFDDITPYIAISSRGRSWVCQIFERPITEADIAEFIKNIKHLECKVERRILISLRDTEENAKLLAKELKIMIWDLDTVDCLLGLYNKKGMVVL